MRESNSHKRSQSPRLVIIADWQAFVNTFFEVFLIKYGNNEATSIKYRATQEMTKYMRFYSGLPQRFGCKTGNEPLRKRRREIGNTGSPQRV